MKKLVLLSLLFLFNILASCTKTQAPSSSGSDSSNTDLLTEWELSRIIYKGDTLKPDDALFLQLLPDSTYSLQSQINECTGIFYLNGHVLKFEKTDCTEVCCETSFSNTLKLALMQLTRYKIEGNTLLLSGPDGTEVLALTSIK